MASTPSARIAALDDVAFAARALAQFMNDHIINNLFRRIHKQAVKIQISLS